MTNNLEGNLSFFSSLTSLEQLWISYNNFSGSLKPLQKLTKLKGLDIEHTNIDSGLEYLPESVEKIWCDGCEKLKENLKNYPQRDEKDYGNKENYIYYDYQGWRKDNFSLINFSRRIMELEREIQMEIEKSEKALENLSIVKEWREKILKEIVKQKNREIQQLQEQINQLQSQLTKIRSQNLQTQMEINC